MKTLKVKTVSTKYNLIFLTADTKDSNVLSKPFSGVTAVRASGMAVTSTAVC